MQFYSTNNKSLKVNVKQAVMQSLAPDKGLYMPEFIPQLSQDFVNNISSYDLKDIAFTIAKAILGEDIPENDLKKIVYDSINFAAPVVKVGENIYSLELWHGPSLAFKDFGARFMAGLMSYFIKGEDKKLTILVATSGDTGGAVAAGFYKVPGIEVIILYPSGKVSDIQEKQLTTLGENITALEINGTFDDCQALVKEAFLDDQLNASYNLSSANSINISRLIPQSFYYFEAFKQVSHLGKDIVFSVPSGNFGNITAGVLAKKLGLPIKRFVAATNVNNIVPKYLETGNYIPKPSIATISNAMDVGNPSNFVRLLDLYNHDLAALQKDISGFWLNDDDTRKAMRNAFYKNKYVCDPHGAIGYQSLLNIGENEVGIFLETAHPAKFLDTVQETLETKISIPYSLASLSDKPKDAHYLASDFMSFKKFLLKR